MANKCSKCGNKKNYNFALNIGLCDICIGEKLEQIEEIEANANTRIICHVESCKSRNPEGICGNTTIHLQPCSPVADNVVACSEFKDKEIDEIELAHKNINHL